MIRARQNTNRLVRYILPSVYRGPVDGNLHVFESRFHDIIRVFFALCMVLIIWHVLFGSVKWSVGAQRSWEFTCNSTVGVVIMVRLFHWPKWLCATVPLGVLLILKEACNSLIRLPALLENTACLGGGMRAVLGQGHRKVIRYISSDLYFLCSKYLKLSSNGFDMRSKSRCRDKLKT